MISTDKPLEEKMALFWHGLFATGYAKLNQARSQLNQVEMFRRNGLGRFDEMVAGDFPGPGYAGLAGQPG